MYYTVDGESLTEMSVGDIISVSKTVPVAFYVAPVDGYQMSSSFSHRHGPTAFETSGWLDNGIYTSIDSLRGKYCGNINLNTARSTSQAKALGCTYEFHYSLQHDDYTYREFHITAQPVEIQVVYDLAGGEGSITDSNRYRHPNVTEAVYADRLTAIAVSDKAPVRDGYAFKGWEFNGDTFWHGDTIQIADIWEDGDTLTYTFTAQWEEQPASLTVTKTIDGVPALPDDFTITVTGEDGRHDTLTVPEAAKSGSTYTWALNALAAGSYTVTEDGADIDGYELSGASVTSDSVTLSPGGSGTAGLSNVYTEKTFTVTWEDYDGNVLETDENVAYGSAPSYDSAQPQRAPTASTVYTFKGWSPSFSPFTEDITYTAVYTESARTYKVTWKDEDGSTLETDENVPYGAMPTYDGDEPTKTPSTQYHYVFDGWTPDVSPVTGDAVYTAKYRVAGTRTYTVTWANYNKITLETDSGVFYGTKVVFDSAEAGSSDVTYNGETPKQTESATHTYEFTGWEIYTAEGGASYDDSVGVAGNITFIAVFKAVPKAFTATVEVILNGTFESDGEHKGDGTHMDITAAHPEADNALYLKPVGSTEEKYTELSRTAQGIYATNGVENGTYNIYIKENGVYTQVGTQDLIMYNADHTRYLPYYSVSYEKGTDDAVSNMPDTAYYYNGSTATVSDAVPVREGYVFKGFSDKAGKNYTGGDIITNNITSAHTLTAIWAKGSAVKVVVKVDHKDEDGNGPDPSVTEDMVIHLAKKIDGSYVEINGTVRHRDVSVWYSPDASHTSTYTENYGVYEYIENDTYLAYATVDGYRHKSSVVSYDESANTYTITVELIYDPGIFMLDFAVKMAEGTPENLIPEAVDIAITYWTGSAWKIMDGYEARTWEIDIEKQADGTYGGTATFPVWGFNNQDEPYYYRISPADIDLGGGYLLSSSGTDNVTYKSTAKGVYPEGAYTAVVSVEGGEAPAADKLLGARAKSVSDLTANAVPTVVISVSPYALVLDPEGGTWEDDTTANITIADIFSVPA
ncbi:MAG: InlB B-repeat-containing protein, partial [Flavobacteriales bacterium]|nr:InlB B-repeat-containing protein [Flavobacteriales bacterium]